MSSCPELKVDWCSYEAAKYAVEHWHYSRTMPAGKLVKIGAWEDGQYIGCVLFGLGATPQLPKSYGLAMTECCELTRVALGEHASPVTQIVAIAIRMLRAFCPGIRLIVSFADMRQGHLGAIYQAGNWIYTGAARLDTWIIHGKRVHPRTVVARYGSRSQSTVRQADPSAEKVWGEKHRYLYPLDKAMRSQIEPLRQPYPKRASEAKEIAHADPIGETGGASPTWTLESNV